MLSLPHRPAHLSQDGPPNLSPFPGPESYYSARDIEILHHVVVTAQADLETLPEGERLATNALFRAYDLVLPRYGVDPEQDHHLSRLVFRVGGERGDKPLFDKFRAVLSRMGIELEFDADVSTSSAQTMSDTESQSHQPIEMRQDRGSSSPAAANNESKQRVVGYVETSYSAQGPSPAPHAGAVEGSSSGLRERGDDRASEESSTKGSVEKSKQRADPSFRAMLSLEPNRYDVNIGAATSQQTLRPAGLLTDEWRKEPVFNQPIVADNRPSTTPPAALQDHASTSQGQFTDHQQPGHRSSQVAKQLSPITSPNAFAEEDVEVHPQLQRRASRAWGLFQLTKAVSHWNVWAEEKLDRAEVARRHMTRYRHFGSWRDKTLDVMLYSRRLLLAQSKGVWQHAVEEAHGHKEAAMATFANTSIQQCLARWASLPSASSSPRVSRGNPQLLSDSISRWWTCASQLQNTGSLVGRTTRSACAQPAMAAWQDLLICHEHAILLRRHRLLRGVLYHWELMRRSREYAIRIADEDVRRVIARWQTLGQRRVPVQRDIYKDRHGAEISVRRDGSYVLAATWRHNLLRDSLSKWQLETSGHAGLWQRAASLSTAVSTYRAISSWHGVNREVDTLQVWASRADRYLVINECLGRARHIARPSWSHTTRTLYARARWRQKHLNVRRIVSSWKRQTRSRDRLDAVARDCEVDSSARRLIQTLHAWQEECEGLLASDWTSHLPGSWINEWAVADELLQLLRDESSAAWEMCLRSKIYNKWRALSVQFHSQSYVVSDVVEKNSRKLTRRILLHWQQSGSGTAHSLASRTASRSTHNPRTSIWSRTQTRPTAASSLMDFGGAQSLEESSLYNAAEHHGLLDTPTRWTGLGSSLTRLPTTTPRAPLSTPFERELRTRYNQTNGAGPSGLSTIQTPRLSAADARRIAEERRRNRPS